VHQDGHRVETLAIVEPQHLYAPVARTVGIQPHDRLAGDHCAAIDVEIDLVFAIANAHGAHFGSRLAHGDAQIGEHSLPPSRLAIPARAGMVVRGGDHDVFGRRAGFLGDHCAKGLDEVQARGDQVRRYDCRFRLAVKEEQRFGVQVIAKAFGGANVPRDGRAAWRCDVDFRDRRQQVRIDLEGSVGGTRMRCEKQQRASGKQA
jgi:hypothetical protein